MSPKAAGFPSYKLRDVKREGEQNLFTVISTFAGGGGSSLGYRLAGGHVLAINEFQEQATKTYQANVLFGQLSSTKILERDIRFIDGRDLLKMTNLRVGELDVLDGSPPCSSFSLAGSRAKGWSKTKAYSRTKKITNIEDLFFEFIRLVSDVRPKLIIGENVKGLTQGSARHKMLMIENAFEHQGYEVATIVLNSARYGVAQSRERVFFICVRNDVCQALGLDFLNLPETVTPEPTQKKPLTIRMAILNSFVRNHSPKQTEMLREHLRRSSLNRVVAMLPKDPARHTKPSDKEFRDRNPKKSYFNLIRPCPDLPSPTLTQLGQQRGRSGVLHPSEDRKLTIIELKRLMGLPDDFKVTGSYDEKAERLCRMVPPPLMAALARHLYEVILRPFNAKD